VTDAKSSLGDATSSLGDATSSLGDATSSLGDATSSLGDANSSLGDAKAAAVWLCAQGYAAAPTAQVRTATENFANRNARVWHCATENGP
jgi:hypothetical protein